MKVKRNSSKSQDGNQLSARDGVNAANFGVEHWNLRKPHVILSMIDEDDRGKEKNTTTLAHIQCIAANLVEATSAAGAQHHRLH